MTTSGLILIRKKQIILVFFVFFAAFAAKVLFFPTYEAETTIIVDLKKGPTSIESEKIDPAGMVSLVRIHSDLLQSTPVLKKVVDELKLYEDLVANPAVISPTEKERLSRVSIDLLRKKYLTVSSPAFTNLIQIKVKYKYPEKAALIANTLVEDYIKWSIDFQHKEAGSLNRYLDKELEAAREKLQKSEESLEQFRTENKIVALPDEIKTYYQMILEEYRLSSQFDQAVELKLLEMEESLNREKFKAYYQLIQATEVKLLELNVELGRLRELYTDISPQVFHIKKNIAHLQEGVKKLKEKVNKDTSQTIKKFNESKKEPLEQGAKSMLKERFLSSLKNVPQKEKLLERLIRQVKIDEDNYIFLIREQEKSRLTDVKETTENIKVVSLALPPLKPSGRITGILTGAVIALLLSFMLAFILEIKGSVFK